MLAQDTKNFLRFLTLTVPGGIEDTLAVPLFHPLSPKEIGTHLKRFAQKPFPGGQPPKTHLNIHIPFCSSLCSYCHCSRVKLKNREQLRDHVGLIIDQIRTFAPLLKGHEFTSLSLLGGTVSLLEDPAIDQLLTEALGRFTFRKKTDIHFEGHPVSLTSAKLRLLRRRGVNRINLGVQTLDEKVLKNIKRNQTRKDVEKCIKAVRRSGFPCLNVDVIAGLPGQTVTSFLKDIQDLIRWKVDLIHINPFSDIVGSACYRENPVDLAMLFNRRQAMILKAVSLLGSAGYSNRSLAGYQRAGLKYKAGKQTLPPDDHAGAVLSLGIFARSSLPGSLVFETLPCDDTFSTARYAGHPVDQRYAMANYATLHLLDGMDIAAFRRLFTAGPADIFQKELLALAEEGLLSSDGKTWRYCGPWTIPGLFNYYSLTKILYGKKMLDALRRTYAAKYDPAADHGSPKNLLRIFQDLWYTRTYYRLGYKSCWL